MMTKSTRDHRRPAAYGWPSSGRHGKVSDIVTPIGREEEIR
jgi:hypothetical protein